jgi:hypothetical protein
MFELAGMATNEGLIGSPVFPLVEVDVPRYINLVGDRLYWSYAVEAETNRPLDHINATDEPLQDIKPRDPGGVGFQVTPLQRPLSVDPIRMLDAFVRIKDGPDVLQFARKYGVLELCAEGDNHPRDLRKIMRRFSPECTPEGWPTTPWHERVEHWLSYVQGANSVLSIAAALYQDDRDDRDELPRASDWHKALAPWRMLVDSASTLNQESPQSQRGLLGMIIDRWLHGADTRPTFRWERSGPKIGLIARTFGMLGVQLMFTVSKSQGLAVCDGCGQAYIREGRKPQRGRMNFCKVCGETVAAKLRKRKQRASGS